MPGLLLSSLPQFEKFISGMGFSETESDPLSLLPCYFRREVTLSSRLRLYPTNESFVTRTPWRREYLSNNCKVPALTWLTTNELLHNDRQTNGICGMRVSGLGLDGGSSSGYGSSGKAKIISWCVYRTAIQTKINYLPTLFLLCVGLYYAIDNR